MGGGGALATAEARLVEGLFVPRERWGWEFVDGGPIEPSPRAQTPPVLRQPDLPDLPALVEQRRRSLKALWLRMALPVGFIVFGVAVAGSGGALFIPAGGGLALLAGASPALRHAQLARGRRRTETLTRQASAAHDDAMTDWRAEIAAHDDAEAHRRAAASAFYPIVAPGSTPRVDVFGGDGNGWASLLATAGGSLLSSGTGILLVDLSERTVGGGLARLAGQAGCPVESWDLPQQLDEVGLLDGLGPREAAEVIADAFAPTGDGEPDHHRRALHADLLSTVGEVLGARLSFRRLAEGLRLLEGLRDPSAATTLTPPEAAAIIGRMNAFGQGDRIADELRFLRSLLEALCPPVGPAGRPGGWEGNPPWADPAAPWAPAGGADAGGHRQLSSWWPVRGLRVLATSSRGSAMHLKELADRLAVQAVLHQLRRRRFAGAPGQDLLVVAGADHLGRSILTSLSRHAEVAGVRLVLLFERLADDAERLLGSQGGSTIIMRLGNGKEATTAAEFIGRGYSFVLSQITAQIGRSFTVGDSDSTGTQDGVSDTTGTSGGSGKTYDRTRILPWLQNTSTNTGWQESVTTSRSQTWQRTINASLSDSTTDGTTSQRVYEFTVEPTTLQTLPATAFLLVSAIDGPGRVTLGDCNPGTVLLSQVSPVDRWTARTLAATGTSALGPPAAGLPGVGLTSAGVPGLTTAATSVPAITPWAYAAPLPSGPPQATSPAAWSAPPAQQHPSPSPDPTHAPPAAWPAADGWVPATSPRPPTGSPSLSQPPPPVQAPPPRQPPPPVQTPPLRRPPPPSQAPMPFQPIPTSQPPAPIRPQPSAPVQGTSPGPGDRPPVRRGRRRIEIPPRDPG